eukprot:m.9654 g.9654  ORF g.9654 m.9654 type:complete len:171 (+) comp4106_c0_seq2:174-686(+)
MGCGGSKVNSDQPRRDHQFYIKELKLKPHPEGGYFKETYRSDIQFNDRNLASSIYYMTVKGSFSHIHRIKSDEMWHFYAGGPLRVLEILPNGEGKETLLGPNLDKGQRLQYVVKAGSWFGSLPVEGEDYSLVGCTVSPGFDFEDFELGVKEELLKEYPDRENIITTLTHP